MSRKKKKRKKDSRSATAGHETAEVWTGTPLPLPPVKRMISVRIDSDVLDHFKSGGPGYQTRMNAVLRAYMEAHRSE